MPTNLNALIRYKQIDSCLRNPYVECTIEKLRDACTDALGESRGIYKRVSKRTIQDDLRVLRSSILGFEAPIVFNNGHYEYLDKEYSIFSTPINEISLLKEILNLLIDEKENIEDPSVNTLIDKISIILKNNEKEFSETIRFKLADSPSQVGEKPTKQPERNAFMKWDEILLVLNKNLKKQERMGKFSWLFNRKRN